MCKARVCFQWAVTLPPRPQMPCPALPCQALSTCPEAKPLSLYEFSVLSCTFRVTTILIHILPATVAPPLAQVTNDSAGLIFLLKSTSITIWML